MRYLIAAVLAFSAATAAYADDCYYYPAEQYGCDECCCEDMPPNFCRQNIPSIGPEIYHITRTRKGGTKQTGTSYGVRFTYDYIKRYNFYIGAQALYSSGTLKGHTGAGDKIRSKLTDEMIEGALGYTFQMKCYPYIAFTPFVGGGYFREQNKFSKPSPLLVKYTITYPYISYGFLASGYVTREFRIGFNARFRSPWEVRCRISDDPDFGSIKQQVEDELQYRLELPLTFVASRWCEGFELSLVPFYERRLYGERQNYPFDFLKTTLKIYGFNLQFIYRF